MSWSMLGKASLILSRARRSLGFQPWCDPTRRNQKLSNRRSAASDPAVCEVLVEEGTVISSGEGPRLVGRWLRSCLPPAEAEVERRSSAYRDNFLLKPSRWLQHFWRSEALWAPKRRSQTKQSASVNLFEVVELEWDSSFPKSECCGKLRQQRSVDLVSFIAKVYYTPVVLDF